MNFNSEKYKEYMKVKQYKMNDRDQWIASRYGDKLTYNEVIGLRHIALRKVLIENNIEVITDLPWGKGLLLYREEWEKMMEKAIECRKGNKNA